MIIARIFGGLGNQMFQYAAARSLSLARGSPLRLDVDDYRLRAAHQGFELSRVFAAPVTLADDADLRRVLGHWWHPRLRRWLTHPRLAGVGPRACVVEPRFHYWPDLLVAPEDCYLSGYWQAPRYFELHADLIRREFSFRQPLGERNAGLVRDIRATPSVSVHVRRGDYASDPKALATHGLCSPEYYAAAMRMVKEQVPGARFFVFSDDMEWTRAHLADLFDCSFVDHNRGADSHVDMRLMSECRHHIVANSSFSWWGAWLGHGPRKIVVAPRSWFAVAKNDTDLVPSEWIRL